jgi:hypothetical protein
MFKVGSFGLENALAKFQRVTDQVLTSFDYAKFYVDDIILFGLGYGKAWSSLAKGV